ncbi:MAG: methyltransferase domain-containing protein [Elusimicrobia bacterium]|nr:methyltransferase domain-containing protein [Elusimicrobiota bacterium]
MKVPPEDRFSEVAGDYARFRPSYPKMLLDWIALTAGLKRGSFVADVGCGTGIATRLWAERGFSVVGVDPNERMLAAARGQGGAEYRRGDACATGLPDASQDMVSVAQAFHWFELDKAVAEFARVLKPEGRCCAFWNLRAREPLQLAYERVLGAHCTDWEEHPRGRQTISAILAHARTFAASEAQFTSSQPMDREAFFGRVRSASYVAHGLKEPDAFWDAVDKLFDEFEKDGMIQFVYDSVAVLWKIR